jgi:16S rRNA G966 N2-methylase RsmD
MTQVWEDIKIDADFASLIPPLSAEERQQLEANIVAHGGARDPLVLWVPSEWTPEGCSEPLRFEDGEPFRADSESEETLIWCGDDDDSYFIEDWPATLLDGHNRYEICTRLTLPFGVERLPLTDRSHAEEWIIRNQFGRRNLSAYVRTQLSLRLEETVSARAKAKRVEDGKATGRGKVPQKSAEPLETRQEIAKVANVSHDTVAKVKRIEEATSDGLVSDETIGKLRSGEISINHVDKKIKKQRAELRAVEKKKVAAAAGFLDGDIVLLGDFRTIMPSIPDGCVDLIFTDPPYDKETVPLYEDMAREAARILRPGGSLICYLGQYATADVCQLVSRHLQFYWTLCCYHEGPGQAMAMRGIRAKWKPMLWFVNGTGRFDTGSMVEDLVVSHKEKCAHPWQQSVVEASYYIERLTPQGGLVVDPFCGGGTTALAAKQTGRKWVTCELDPEYAAIATQRIKEWTE